MKPRTVTLEVLDGVPKGVPVIENGTHVGEFPFIQRNNLGFQFAGATDDVCKRVRFAREQSLHVVLEPVKQRSVANDAVLNDFGEARTQFALGQGR